MEKQSSGKLSGVAKQLILDLNRQVPLSGKSIQVVGGNFQDRDSGTMLPFSDVLNDALAPHLTQLGANVTVQERGETPFCIVGNYAKNPGSNIYTITLRLRRIDSEASSDLAGAQREICLSPEQLRWFRFSYENSAQAMVQSLLNTFVSSGEDIHIGKIQLAPRDKNRLSLKFGPSFTPHLRSALSGLYADSFDYTGNGQSRLRGQYAVRQGAKTKVLELAFDIIGPGGRIYASNSVFYIDAKYIPDEDWVPISRIMVMPGPESPGSPALKSAVRTMAGYLAQKGLSVKTAPKYLPDRHLNAQGIRVAITVDVSRLTEDTNQKIIVLHGHARMRDTYTQNSLGTCRKPAEQLLPGTTNKAIRQAALKNAGKTVGEKLAWALYRCLVKPLPKQ